LVWRRAQRRVKKGDQLRRLLQDEEGHKPTQAVGMERPETKWQDLMPAWIWEVHNTFPKYCVLMSPFQE
jgi:hypothetical protein